MGNEYNGDKIVLRDTSGNQMSLARFFELALNDGNGHGTTPSQGKTSSFNPNHHAWDMHSSRLIDVVPVRTPTFGTVTRAGDGWNGGMGTCAIITDEKGLEHRFMHMAEGSLQVAVGDAVSQGDTLGKIGSTGDSTGPHLHYDVLSGGTRIDDPIDAYDSTTLPSGWNMVDAAAAGNWNYIQLDDTATDYGPPGGETPSEPYYPDKPCHDIAHPQVSGGSLNPCIDAIADAGDAGVIIQVGAIRSSGFSIESSFDPAEAVQKVFDRGLGLGIYFYNYAAYATDQTQAFQDALAYLQTIGATKEKVNLGIWLDTEYNPEYGYDPVPSSDPAVNYAYVERFMNVFNAADYPVVGVYSSAGNFESWYGSSRMGDKPIWAAYWTGTFDTVDRSTLDYYLPEASYTKVYMMQYSDHGRVPGWSGDLDCVKVLMPMPTSGGGGGGGGGGSYTEVIKVTVDVIPPKRIYFSPVPGIIPTLDTRLDEREQQITITTDADNASLYYTLDGSSPYQYTTNNGTTAYTVAANALLYSSSITINKDTHIRVIAVPSGTSPGMTFDEPLAKGSGTFLFQYQSVAQTWEEEQKSYATSDGAVSFFEENKQAFLRLHAEQTDEEILYTEVYRHDTQVAESDASDSASKTEEGGQPTYDGSDEPTDTTEEEGDAGVSNE